MGRTLKKLASAEVSKKTVFNNRFVVEICEKVHVHYRNLRILMSIEDWKSMAEGMAQSLDRWKKRGEPMPSESTHIELCRKEVAKFPQGENVLINYNDNLYLKNEDRIFSEGADFKDEQYIHLKIRDLRLELSVEEFNQLADAITNAKETLCQPQS